MYNIYLLHITNGSLLRSFFLRNLSHAALDLLFFLGGGGGYWAWVFKEHACCSFDSTRKVWQPKSVTNGQTNN